MPLPEPGGTEIAIASEELPQLRIFDEELARLHAERSAARREMLPSLALTGNYRLYGADQGSPGRTLGELENRDAGVGLVLRWELYSGGRDRLKLARLEEERQRVTLQRQERAAELQQEIGSLQQALRAYQGGAEHRRARSEAFAEVVDASERLGRQGLIDRAALIERAIAAQQQELEMEVLDLQRRAEALRLRFWQEGVGS